MLTETPITQVLEKNYMPYVMKVILSRAIPQIDGFKPAHRKLLYTMYKMGLLNGGRVKSADIVGQTMRLNPHGEQAIYETLVRLTRGNSALNHPFVDSKGNFGKQYSRDMAYAASRYTEAKLDGICAEIFRDLDKNNVDMVDNYNSTMKEPVLLPTTFPNVLVTPNMGIAVGMASSVASFNLREVCEATIAYIKDPEADLGQYLLGPDFSTGGELIYNKEELAQIYATGRGSVKVRAKYSYDKKNSCIEVTEIPYTTTIEAIIDKVAALVKAGKLKDITDIRDETGLNGLKIAIDIRRAADPDAMMAKLFAMTTLMDSFSCNFNILVDDRPKTMGVSEIIGEWLRFRKECIRRRVRYDLEENGKKLHLLEGLSQVLLDIDRAIRIIRETEDDKQVIPHLMEGFNIDKIQAEYIAEIKLRNLNRSYFLNRMSEIEDLKKQIEELNKLLNQESLILALITKELKEVAKKYGKDRLTTIVKAEVEKLPKETLIDDYAVRLILTEHGYFKKVPLSSLRGAPQQAVKEDDRISISLDGTNLWDVLFFTSERNVYKLKAHEVQDAKPSALGEYMPSFLGLSDGESVVFMAATLDYAGFLLFAFENGKIAKVDLTAYQTKMNRKKLLKGFSDRSELVYAEQFIEDEDIIAFRGTEKALLINTALIPLVGSKDSVGVSVLTLKKNSQLSLVQRLGEFEGPDPEFFRGNKIPSSGHFINYQITMDSGVL